MQRDTRILEDGAAVAKTAAELVVAAAQAAVGAGRVFTMALAGGSTPKALYRLLSGDEALRAAMPWDKMQVFFGDERHVPPDHADSNFRMASEALLARAPLAPGQVVRIKGEYADAGVAATEYQAALEDYFKLAPGAYPRLDVVLLGMGNDGHTLSLFPGTKALRPDGRLVVSNWIGKLYTERVTLTAPVVNQARLAIFMVTGADKAPALKAVLEGPQEPDQLPSQLIQPKDGKVVWLVDAGAGALLRKEIL